MPVCPQCGDHADKVGEICDKDGHFFVEEEALEHADDDPMLGRYLGDRFAVMSLLGGGGMGKVYEAMQYPVGRRVALKVLKASLQENERFLARFQREAQAIASLNHPNIVTLYDFGSDQDGTHYIAMEYVEGRLLTMYLRENVDTAFVVHVAAQVLAALQEAHEHGIVHRDLKPDNVMLTSVGGDDVFVKVLDFGLAQLATEGDVAITAAGEVFGTPLYMSPEQATGEEIEAPSDLYSLACIMYELLTGRPPFRGTRPMNVLMKHVNAPVPPMEFKPDVTVSPELQQVIMTCLAKHGHERYPTAMAMLEAIFQTPEGRTLAQSAPSMARSLDIPMVPTEQQPPSRSTMVSGSSNPAELLLSAPGEMDPVESTQPPVPAESEPGLASSEEESSTDRRFILIGAGVAALVIVGVVLFFVLGGDSSTGDANATVSARGDSEQVRAINAARAVTHRTVEVAELGARARFALRDFAQALKPGGELPEERRVRGPKLPGVAWHNQIKVFHRKELTISSYTDPVDLVFGEQ